MMRIWIVYSLEFVTLKDNHEIKILVWHRTVYQRNWLGMSEEIWQTLRWTDGERVGVHSYILVWKTHSESERDIIKLGTMQDHKLSSIGKFGS